MKKRGEEKMRRRGVGEKEERMEREVEENVK
jgi:hypothetical protein